MTGAGRAALEVSDNGAGVPAELVERIFVLFFTTRKSGTGLVYCDAMARNVDRARLEALEAAFAGQGRRARTPRACVHQLRSRTDVCGAR